MKSQALFDQVAAVPKDVWCNYLLDRDLLVDRFTPEQRQEFIAGATQCGEQLAQSVEEQFPGLDAEELAEKLCKVRHADSQSVNNQIFLATFTEPDDLKVFDEPMAKIANLHIEGFDRDVIYKIVLGHELFHYFEAKDPNIYTSVTKIDLWHILGYHHRSTVRSTSEIAAMIFSWQFNRLDFSPLVLNILMEYCYKPEAVEPGLKELATIAEKIQTNN